MIINYRLNGGFIPADHWIQSNEGGGRNIGEACHMYDLFRSLSRAPVKSINASSIDPAQSAYLRNDNFVATMTYEDGSVGTLTYTSLGPKQGMPKERIEVFMMAEPISSMISSRLPDVPTGKSCGRRRLRTRGISNN